MDNSAAIFFGLEMNPPLLPPFGESPKFIESVMARLHLRQLSKHVLPARQVDEAHLTVLDRTGHLHIGILDVDHLLLHVGLTRAEPDVAKENISKVSPTKG